jgi:ribonuclease BN (tRNA processing enzyme)
MAPLRLIPLGVGNAFSARYYSTSLAVVMADGRWLLVDCPHPIHKILREAALASGVELTLASLAGVALTHLHADHSSGLEGLGGFLKYVLGSSQRPGLFALPAVLDQLRKRHEAELFDLIPVADTCQAGPFTILARPVTHGSLPAGAFRVAAAGRSVGHSGDTCFDPGLIRWLNDADRFAHEAGAETEPRTHHTAYSELAGLPEALRRKMRLVHYPDDFDLAASVIEPLRQGKVYEV